MNKTKFLAVLAIPALLAACSQDEFTENAIDKNVDLSNRKALENVVLNFGDADALTRGTIGTSSWNSYKWTSEDGVGACIIDAPNTTTGGYDIVEYISSNYKYYWTADNQWKTDALMVEGNYMFYAPYSEKHMVRSNIVAKVPTTQNVLTKTDDNNAIKEFYESGDPVFVGYKFLAAENQPKVIDVAMKHIFAYPLFKLTNLYDTREDKTKGTPTYQDIKITKIELKCADGNKFKTAFVANNANIEAKLKVGSDNPWDAGKHESNVTAGLFDVATDSDGNEIGSDKITINLGEGITLKGEESLSFHAVLPAAAYEDGITVIAYDDKGNTYSPKAKDATTGLTLNPGYRYPAQEYNTDGTLKESKGQLLTFKLEDKNAAPTDIMNNDDFIAYLKSLSVRYNNLEQVGSDKKDKTENEFVLNGKAKITINSALIDALDNYNYVAGAMGKVTFTTTTIALASDVVITEATTGTNDVELKAKSATGKEYAFVLPTQNVTDGAIGKDAAGTFVINAESDDVEITVAKDVKAPVNIIAIGGGKTDGVTFAGVNANKITSLNVVETGSKLTLTGNVSGVVINNSASLVVNRDMHIDSKIVNNGTVTNNGIMFNTANVNNGTITVGATAAVTKIGAGIGIVNNTNAKPVIVGANATQKVTWEGNMAGIYTAGSPASGLSVTGSADLGINTITITDVTVNATLALLKAPVKGCTVSTITFSAATALNMKDGGSMAGLTLVFDEDCKWTGDIVNAPNFTNATIRVKDTKALTIDYANVSGKLDKSVNGYKDTTTQKIVKGTGATINF